MQTRIHAETLKDQQLDEELADTLTAASILSKRLAQKIRTLSTKEQKENEVGTPNGSNTRDNQSLFVSRDSVIDTN